MKIRPSTPARQVRAIRATSPITIDGNLNEKRVEGRRSDGLVPAERTPTRARRGLQRCGSAHRLREDAIYVGARLYDTAPDSILARARAARRLDSPPDRFLGLPRSVLHDRRSGYYFMRERGGHACTTARSHNDGWRRRVVGRRVGRQGARSTTRAGPPRCGSRTRSSGFAKAARSTSGASTSCAR